MTQESAYSLLVRQGIEPLSDDNFLAFMAAMGSISPPAMTTEQIVSLLASILQNYCNPEDVDTMERLTELAIDTVVGFETAVALDLSVGPDDGVH